MLHSLHFTELNILIVIQFPMTFKALQLNDDVVSWEGLLSLLRHK